MRFFVIILIALLCFACSSDESANESADKNSERIPTQESWNSDYRVTEDGLLKAIMFARHTRKYSDKKETLMDTLKVDFYDEHGIKTTTLTSYFGKINDQNKNMVARDSVVAINEDGTMLETEELHWNNRTRKITTEKFVTITTKDEIIKGYGLESDQNLKNYKIFEPVINADAKKVKSEKK
ncbi:MAG: LPS export ABC transporter periplasmic protein LptC [Rhodothermaceae bacterium]